MNVLDLRYFKMIGKDFSGDKMIEYINDSVHKILFVTGEKGELIGSVTDGDLRRNINKNNFTAENIMNRNPKFIFEKDFKNITEKEILKNKVNYLPVLDENKIPVKVIYFDLNFQEYYDDIKVVIMAGGKGLRLLPITRVIPKPLVPFKEKTIIENIMEQFIKYGFYDFIFTVNYKKDMIKSYFSELYYSVSYIEEENFLGTAGSLGYIETQQPIIVSNCDILLDVDYSVAFKEHILNGNDVTVFSAIESVDIPYGVIKEDESRNFIGIEEKPILNYMVNTGIYILSPKVIELIKKGEKTDMPELIERAMNKGYNVRVYNSDKKMTDIGQWEYYKKFIKE